MKRLCLLLPVFFTATLLAACSGAALNPTAPNAGSSVRSHAFGDQSPAVTRYKLLYRFKGTPDGASPYSGLIALNGKLYGTTLNGSKNYCAQSCGSNNCYLGCGTVFSVDSAGAERVVYNFKGNFNGGSDGSWPFAGLTLWGEALYGVTSGAGAGGHGTVYTFTPGKGERVVYGFVGGENGISPEGSLIVDRDDLFGTTVLGGSTNCGGSGCGTVYRVLGGKEATWYSFQGGSDGAKVYAPVTALGERLYGATLEGGQGCGSTGCGTIFQMGTFQGSEKVIYRFSNNGDGAFPNGLTAVGKVLYGTTESGGTKNSGTFFSVTPSGTLKTLYNFQDIPDGNLPGASLIYSNGNFYGTTVGGGAMGKGTVFKITPSGTETVLYSFKGGTDGWDPQGPLYLFNGWLYGTTTDGGTGCGSNGCGTVFKVKP